MTRAVGASLGGRYVLESLIATGGMGEVWKAVDSQMDRPVAVKLLKDSVGESEVFLKRFRNEAKNAAGLAHPNIAQVLDYGDVDGLAFLVMEFVAGQPLSSILERERTLSESRLVSILQGTCRGLEKAHLAGVIHRDIKPGNMLVEGQDHVKITDFGVSRSTDQTTLTATGMVMGTAQYLAPELALGKPATPVSDLYALGVVAYESVAGKRPFVAANPVDIAISHVNDDVPPLPSTVSPELATVIMQLLEKNPRKRPHSARELEAILVRLTVSDERAEPAASAPPSAAVPARRMPPSIAPRTYRPRPDVPRRQI